MSHNTPRFVDKQAHTWASNIGNECSGFGSAAGESVVFGYWPNTGKIYEFDWSNTNSGGTFAAAGSNAAITLDPAGTVVKLVREVDGTAKLYTGGVLRFTTGDANAAPVRFWVGGSKNIDFDNVEWTAY